MRIFKGLLMMAAGVLVIPIIDWFEDLKDKERLRVVNERREARGEAPFATLWEYHRAVFRAKNRIEP
jgi:hypothetical protein